MDATPPAPPSRCLNCDAPVSTPYCSACGQSTKIRRLTFWMVVADFFAHSFAYDSRLWQTLVPLMTKPGWVTKENLRERWVKYVPPLRLYLVISLLFFASLSFVLPERAGSLFKVTNSEGQEDSTIPIDEIELFPDGTLLTNWVNERLTAKIEKLNEMSPEMRDFAIYRGMIGSIPTTLLVAVPLFALGLKFFYLLRRRYFFDHFIFATHFYSAWLLVLGPSILINEAWLWIAGHAVYLPVHLFLALRRVYDQHWAITVIKMILLGFWQIFSSAVLLITVLLSAVFSV